MIECLAYMIIMCNSATLIDASWKHLLQFACKNTKKPFHFQIFILHNSVCNNIVISKTPFSYYFK